MIKQWTDQCAEDDADAAGDEDPEHEELLLVVLLQGSFHSRRVSFTYCDSEGAPTQDKRQVNLLLLRLGKALIGSVRVGSVHEELRPDPNSS